MVIRELTHDPTAFTQGLEYYKGRLFESTGAPADRSSSIRELDPESGGVLRVEVLDGDLFAEGITFYNDRLFQLTWRDGVAIVWDPEDFEQLRRFEFEGEGWGICFDGRRLVMSDGSDKLQFRDPETFRQAGNPVAVTLRGDELPALNELECVDGTVWANVWQTDLIVEIDPASGEVLSLVDASELGVPRPEGTEAVLNGIAYNPDEEAFLLAGKDWPTIYLVNFEPTENIDNAGSEEGGEGNGEADTGEGNGEANGGEGNGGTDTGEGNGEAGDGEGNGGTDTGEGNGEAGDGEESGGTQVDEAESAEGGDS